MPWPLRRGYLAILKSCDVSTFTVGTFTGRANEFAVQISRTMPAASNTPAEVNP